MHRRSRRWIVLAVAAAVLGFVLLALAVSVSASVWSADVRLHTWLLTHRRPWLTTVALAITATGATDVVLPLLAFVALLATRGTWTRRLIRAVVACSVLLVGVGVRLAVSDLVARPRPSAADWAGYAAGYAYPSGHTTAAAMAAGLIGWLVIARFGRRAAFSIVVVVTSWAAAVGMTRAYLGVHWPTDVLGGWFLGLAWVCGCAAVTAARPGVNWVTSPEPR